MVRSTNRRKQSPDSVRRRHNRRQDFYSPVTPTEAAPSATSPAPDGPAADIARLQLHLRRAVSRRPGDTRLLLRTSEIWLRAALAAHRVSPSATSAAAQRAAAVYTAIEAQLHPDEAPRPTLTTRHLTNLRQPDQPLSS